MRSDQPPPTLAPADHYDTHVARFVDPMTAVLVASLPDLGPAARVLDHGTGTGAVARAVAARLPASTIIAIDPNEALLRRLQRDAPRRIEARLGTIDQVVSADEMGCFDLVTSQLALAFTADPHREL